ncbi:DUF3558 family protein [Longimycelium tulufanense]|uniref:DUF3558 family protein n=1 Tax=Longimycelium tulufanense TaxID=907463 RepID=UPI003570D251
MTLAACQTGGSPSASDPTGNTTVETTSPSRAAGSGTADSLTQLDPCELITAAEASTLGPPPRGTEDTVIATAPRCKWNVPGNEWLLSRHRS